MHNLISMTCPNCGGQWPVIHRTCPVCGRLLIEAEDQVEMEDTSANKADQGKLRYDLVPTWPLEQLAAVMTYGAKTYGVNDWRQGMKYSKLYSAAQRHMNAFWKGDDTDKDSGLPHLAHAAANMLMLLEYCHRGYDDLGFDDSIYEVYTAEDILAMVQEGTS